MEIQSALHLLALILAVAGPGVLLAYVAFHHAFPWRTLLVVAAPAGLLVWSVFVEPRMLEARHVAITDPDWRAPRLRIGVIADTHVPGPNVSPERVQEIVARMNAMKPDVVFLLGDYVEGERPAARRAASERSQVLRGIDAFSDLDAPLGVYAVLGNHDYWYDPHAVRRALEQAGVIVLENEGHMIAWQGAPVWIGGLGDVEGVGADIPETLKSAPGEASVVMLAHRPDVFADMPARVALTLVGHTHCGQINLPLFGRIVPASYGSIAYPCGSYDTDGRKLYVSGGVGTSIAPVRFRAPPEIALVTLGGVSAPPPAPPSPPAEEQVAHIDPALPLAQRESAHAAVSAAPPSIVASPVVEKPQVTKPKPPAAVVAKPAAPPRRYAAPPSVKPEPPPRTVAGPPL
ncbi:MAG: metallophosphoesterase [Hyphomonadaceae bacterium]